MNLPWLSKILDRGKLTPNDPSRTEYVFQPLNYVPIDLRLTTDEMLGVSMVWAAIRNIVDPIASSDVNIFTKDANGRKLLPDENLAYLLNVRPNPDLTAQAFKEIILTETLVEGNGYAEIVKDKGGRVVELWPIQSDRVKVTRSEVGQLIYVISQVDGKQITLSGSEVIHVRGPSIRGFLGDSNVYRAAKSVALAVAQERFAGNYYTNNTVMGGVLEVPGTMTEAVRKRLASDWKAKHGGKTNSHSVAVLEGGAKFVQFQVDADKSQLVPSRTFSVEDVARYFGVPLVRLGVQAAAQGYGTNVSQLNLQFVRDTLTPWVNRFAEEVAYKCFPSRAPWRQIEIDLQWLTLGDALQRAQAHEVFIRTGVMTVNECRAIEGLNSMGPDGDLHLIGSGYMELCEDNLEPTAQLQPEPPEEATSLPESEAQTDSEGADSQDVTENALRGFQRRLNARVADLKRNNKPADLIEQHKAKLIDAGLKDFPGMDPKRVRTALSAIAAGATLQQAQFNLAQKA